jgi:uncharacterized membrane protein YfbV (UPF0208 family)
MQQLAQSPSQQSPCPIPHGLVSLWDIMHRFPLRTLESISVLQATVQHWLALEASQPPRQAVFTAADLKSPFQPMHAVVPEEPKSISGADAVANMMRDLAKDLGLSASQKNLRNLHPRTDRELAIAYNMIMNELDDFLFLYIRPDRRIYWESREWIPKIVREKHREPTQELVWAGTAHACTLYTASVFHSMRALEKGLRAIAGILGIAITGDEQWKQVIEQIEKAARKLDNTQSYPDKKSDQQFYSELALHLGLCKDAWRNHVAHAKEIYSEAQSLDVLQATCRFYEKASERISDDGAGAPLP